MKENIYGSILDFIRRNKNIFRIIFAITSFSILSYSVITLAFAFLGFEDFLGKLNLALKSYPINYFLFGFLIFLIILCYITLYSIIKNSMNKIDEKINSISSNVEESINTNNHYIENILTLPYFTEVKRLIDAQIQAEELWIRYNEGRFNSAKNHPTPDSPDSGENTTGRMPSRNFGPLSRHYQRNIVIDENTIREEALQIVEREKLYSLSKFLSEPQLENLDSNQIKRIEKYRRSKLVSIEKSKLIIEKLKMERDHLISEICRKLDGIRLDKK